MKTKKRYLFGMNFNPIAREDEQYLTQVEVPADQRRGSLGALESACWQCGCQEMLAQRYSRILRGRVE